MAVAADGLSVSSLGDNILTGVQQRGGLGCKAWQRYCFRLAY